jgi:hypothetical protein
MLERAPWRQVGKVDSSTALLPGMGTLGRKAAALLSMKRTSDFYAHRIINRPLIYLHALVEVTKGFDRNWKCSVQIINRPNDVGKLPWLARLYRF